MFLLAEVVFASRLLGLVAGEQHVNIQVDATVRSVEVLRDGASIATLRDAPWSTVVDFGIPLAPHELTVIARDAAGNELGRDTQPINVARPPAELGVLLDRDASGNVTAKIRSSHFAHRAPRSIRVKLDNKTMSRGRSQSVSLGVVDPSQIHVVGVDVEFPDGIRARKEVVFGSASGYSEQMPAELTPVAVRQKKNESTKGSDCFRSGEAPLHVSTIEKGSALALFIFNGSLGPKKRMDPPQHRTQGLFGLYETEMRVVNPTPERIARDNGETGIFDSVEFDGNRGVRRLLDIARPPQGFARIADAAGAAALIALRGGKRRAVVVILGVGEVADRSAHQPASIRSYLARVGVPLRVWSLTGPRPDLAETWGSVIDVSTSAALLAATEDLRHELDSQRVAWLPVAPLDAFRVSTTADCAYAPLSAQVH